MWLFAFPPATNDEITHSNDSMKAVIWTAYGSPDVLRLQDIAKPAPRDHEVLIKLRATTVTSGDCEQRSLKLPFWYRLPMRAYLGFDRPKRKTILGMDVAGEVEAAGHRVERFQPGDAVFGATGFAGMGTYAEYICLPEAPEEGALAPKPGNMTYEEAAAVPTGGLEALSFLRQGNLRSGEKVLINGAGGTIGTFAVQLARHFGAEVTAVDGPAKLEMLGSLGAACVIDYTAEDYTQNRRRYDLILDLISRGPFSGSINSLTPTGRYLIANPGLSQMLRGRWVSMTGGKIVLFGAAHPLAEDLEYLKDLIEAGIIRTVIDKTFPLGQVPEAHQYVETGEKLGHVVITVTHNNKS